MKRLLLFLALISLAMGSQVNMVIFYGQGCPHCAALLSWLNVYEEQHPDLNITKFEVYYNSTNRGVMQDFASAYNTQIQGVPTTFIDDAVLIGYSDGIRQQLESKISECEQRSCVSPFERVYKGKSNQTAQEVKGDVTPASKTAQMLTIPLLLSAAAVDAINPCAFAVLILLLSTVCCAGNRKKALMGGLAFTSAVYLSYFLMGVGLFKAIQATSLSYYFYKLVGVMALIVGVFNIKDFVKHGSLGFVMEVPRSWRPLMKKFIKGVTSIPGAFFIGLVVSLFLLPCTSGPYIVILGMLANQATMMKALPLLLLYNLVFVLPMIVITLLVYFGFTTAEKAEKWRSSRIRFLHLIAGLIMIGMGLAILLVV